MTTFADLNLIEPLLRAVADVGYTQPTPIQMQAIPSLLEGRDVLGCAQTGTGKTAAFSLPVLQHMAARGAGGGRKRIGALVLSPTRELAAQIGQNFATYAKYLPINHLVIFGGVKQGAQVRALRAGVDVLVATPGRLLDLISQGHVDLSAVDFLILDEADRMLDMGFIHDIRRVLALLPKKRQNLLFSATMPPSIVKLAGGFLHKPVQVEVTPESTTVEKINQVVMFVERGNKRRLLAELVKELAVRRAIVFTRTKHGANRLVKQLQQAGIEAAAIHGNKSQNARQRALAGFKAGEIHLLVATDIASRGIDVEGVTHVFNFDLPNEPESYVHRIGRTARAGKEGTAIAFCDSTEGDYLRDIERLIGAEIPTFTDHEWHSQDAVPPKDLRAAGRRSNALRAKNRSQNSRGPRQGGGRPGARPGGRPGSGGRPGGGGGRGRGGGGGGGRQGGNRGGGGGGGRGR